MTDIHVSRQWKRARGTAVFRWQMSGRPDCPLCDRPIVPPEQLSVDHKVPIEDGGAPYDQDNLRVTHLWCNLSRAKGGTSISAQRRQAVKTRNGWRAQPEDLAPKKVYPGPSRDW
ncbi:MAG TPA: HNH endonuclease signature motif containing protein [Acidimicrobiales bacterium]|nr:HNH endonuclease signature motif containing protein [Acidimicrobiales bacterium]